jgi:hypothetical protein
MSSRTAIKQFISATEPAGTQIGDEWYNTTTSVLYKRTLVNGVVGWANIGPFPPNGTRGQVATLNSSGAVSWTSLPPNPIVMAMVFG